MTELPSSPYPVRGEIEPNQAQLDKLMPALREAAQDAAELMVKHHFDEGVVRLSDDNPKLAGEISFKREPQGQGLSLELSGKLGGNLPQFRGRPYTAGYTGEFYYREPNGVKNFATDGQRVHQGKIVGWAVGEAKDQQYGVRAEEEGIIQLVAKDGAKVTEDDVLFYIESSSK